jgi:hypothetical protein
MRPGEPTANEQLDLDVRFKEDFAAGLQHFSPPEFRADSKFLLLFSGPSQGGQRQLPDRAERSDGGWNGKRWSLFQWLNLPQSYLARIVQFA